MAFTGGAMISRAHSPTRPSAASVRTRMKAAQLPHRPASSVSLTGATLPCFPAQKKYGMPRTLIVGLRPRSSHVRMTPLSFTWIGPRSSSSKSSRRSP